MDDCEYNPDAEPMKWDPAADQERFQRGDKPPKGGKGRHGQKKPKDQRENPDFDDIPGYDGLAFRADTAFAPPAPPPGLIGEAPSMTFNETSSLTETQVREALQEYVDSQLCFGKKPAQEMTILNIGYVTAYDYILETFTEKRKTKKKKKPYKGGFVDGPENGEAPMPWAIPVSCKQEFKNEKIKKEVPHTAKVKKCKDCKGRGYETCDECDGWGKVECPHCEGEGHRTITPEEEGGDDQAPCAMCGADGVKMCTDCGGDGRVTCEDCDGYKKLRCFIQLKVEFTVHKDEYVYETTQLPDHLIKGSGGILLFQQELPMVWPVQSFHCGLINENSARMVAAHRTNWPEEFIHKQKQTLRGVPVTEVRYKWEDFESSFWVYGTDRQVYAPDYPQQCCCGCSIL